MTRAPSLPAAPGTSHKGKGPNTDPEFFSRFPRAPEAMAQMVKSVDKEVQARWEEGIRAWVDVGGGRE